MLRTLLAFLLSASCAFAQNNPPAWLWARTGGGATSTDSCRGAACDASGATYITGDFYGPDCLLGGALYDSVHSGADAYIIKYFADGTPAWVRVIGGSGAESGVDIDTDSTGSAILAGTFGSSPLNCGTNASGEAVSITLPSGGGRGVLLVKVNALGQTLWAAGFNGTGTAAGNEIATGPNDEVLVIGPYAQNGGATLTFPNGTTITKAGGDQDVFVAKFSSAGVFEWGFGLNGDAHEEGRGIAADAAGNVLVCGEFDGNLTLGSTTHATAGSSDIFVAKYSPAGALLWSRKFGGTGEDAARGIDGAPDGGVYVSGEFTGTVSFGSFALTAAGTTKDLFLIKMSAGGEVLWARSFGSPGNDQGCEIEADAAGNVFCAGSARTGLVFPGDVTLGSAGLSDQFVAKFDANGTLLWATNGGGAGSDSNFAIGLDPQGRVTVVGFYSGSAAYGPHTITGHGSSIDFYAARLDTDSAAPQAPVADFTGSPTSGSAPLTVTFTDQSTGSPTSWAWDFDNDGTTDSTAQNPAFTFTSAGTYSVKLTVGNAQGTHSLTRTNYITAMNPNTLAAAFTASVMSGSVPLTVTFTDQSTGGPTSWEWDFQNDRTVDSTAQNPTFTFTQLGTYSVKLTVRKTGATDSLVKTLYIDVSDPDEATLYPEQTFTVNGQPRTFHLHLPVGYTGRAPVPLVLDLHGSGGRGDFIAKEHGWLPLSDQHGFIVVFPNGGELFGSNGGYRWNSYWQRAEPDDAAYLAALIRHLRQSYNIDGTRIYMTGHSAGAAMCNTFAVFHGDLLAAAAPVNGNWLTTFGLPENLLAPLVPLPVWTWRGENENQLTGLETREVQDAKQKAWWMSTLGAGPVQPPVSSSDGTYHYLDEVYTHGSAEYRFTVEVGQHHPYRPQYATRIWNEFFSRLTRHPLDRLSAPSAPQTFPLGAAMPTGDPWRFYGWTAAPDGSLVTVESSPDLASWAALATAKIEGSHRAMFLRDHGTAMPQQFFYRAQVSPAPVLAPAEASLVAGGTQTFSVTNGVPVTWSIVEPGGGSISASGIYTAPATAGTYHVRATAQSDAALFTEATVHVVAVSPAELARYTAAADYSGSVLGDGLLIMKGGAIVFERYVAPTTAASAHLLASGTKSFSAALFALGAADGLWTLDENVAQTITEWQGVTNKQDITIRQLITLTSGLLDSPAYSAGNAANLDTYELAINESSTPQPPGAACIYAPSNFQVLAAVFERKTGLDPVQYLYDRLLARLGFSAAHLALWTRDIQGKPQMAGGAYFDARAWANYGKLWLQNGQWEGQTLLDPQFLNLAVTYDNTAFKGYGFTWWLNLPTGNTYNPGVDQIPSDGRGDGTQIATNAPTDMFMAAGTGKQRLYVIPSLDLVIVRYGRGVGGTFSDHTLLGHILGAP
jgi:PKD repeat protein